MTRAAFILLFSTCLGVSSAAEPDPKSLAIPAAIAAEAADWVRQLADRQYAERDEATKELRKLGRLALPTLQEALASNSNPEVRLRVELLLPAAIAADIRAKVECFLADEDGKYQHDLPGAKSFFASVGRTPVAKKLFADIMRSANRDLLVAVDGPEANLQRKYLDRRNDLHLSANTPIVVNRPGVASTGPTAVDMAALLFAESKLPDSGPTVGVGSRNTSLLSNYNFQTLLRNMLQSDDRKEALTAVLDVWMNTRAQAQSIYSAISFMNRFNLPNALPAARKLVSGKVTGGSTFYRGYACAYVSRFGTTADLPVLDGLHDDKGVMTNVFVGGVGNKRHPIQTRDVALAMSLLLAKQNPTDYGFTYRYSTSGNSETLKYNYSAYYFVGDTDEKTDAKREAAFKKYAEWKAKQPKAKK